MNKNTIRLMGLLAGLSYLGYRMYLASKIDITEPEKHATVDHIEWTQDITIPEEE